MRACTIVSSRPNASTEASRSAGPLPTMARNASDDTISEVRYAPLPRSTCQNRRRRPARQPRVRQRGRGDHRVSVALGEGGSVARPKLKVTSVVLNALTRGSWPVSIRDCSGGRSGPTNRSGSRWPIPTVVSASHSSARAPTCRPTWPADTEHQQMMMHLDIEVEDLQEVATPSPSARSWPSISRRATFGSTTIRPDTRSVCGWRARSAESRQKPQHA